MRLTMLSILAAITAAIQTPRDVNFIRPGLQLKITEAAIQADGTMQARVKISDPKGLPLDRDGIAMPGAVSISFVAAYIARGDGGEEFGCWRISAWSIGGMKE